MSGVEEAAVLAPMIAGAGEAGAGAAAGGLGAGLGLGALGTGAMDMGGAAGAGLLGDMGAGALTAGLGTGAMDMAGMAGTGIPGSESPGLLGSLKPYADKLGNGLKTMNAVQKLGQLPGYGSGNIGMGATPQNPYALQNQAAMANRPPASMPTTNQGNLTPTPAQQLILKRMGLLGGMQ